MPEYVMSDSLRAERYKMALEAIQFMANLSQARELAAKALESGELVEFKGETK